MAGIINAKKLKQEGKDTGKVVAKGYLEGSTKRYIIIQLDNDLGYITQYDYGSDVRISPIIGIGSRVKLDIEDDYTARWRLEKFVEEKDEIEELGDTPDEDYDPKYRISFSIDNEPVLVDCDSKDALYKLLRVAD